MLLLSHTKFSCISAFLESSLDLVTPLLLHATFKLADRASHTL